MTAPNYTKSIDVQAAPSVAFKALTEGVAHWWTRPDQPLTNIGDRAKFKFPPSVSYWTFELTSAEEPDQVEWTCVDALHIHEVQPKEIETEWLNTKVLWKISEEERGCRIEMQHQGLT